MNPYIVAFITGLTTGGLSCLAVQGGLLASSLSSQIEQDMLSASSKQKKGAKGKIAPRPQTALPIALFLAAKIVAYTLLGFLLGALGSVLALNTTTRAILLIAIGIFMLGNALRMLNVHPIFRYFAIEPPKFITRVIRRTAKNSTDFVTPIFLGALTVFIPCGVTQAMMAVALATGSPLQGAGIMFAFTLGTSPVFFSVAYLATRIGAKLERYFMTFVAVVVLILGLVSIDAGLTLMGFPYSATNLADSFTQAPQVVDTVSDAPAGTLTLSASNHGYSPKQLTAKAGQAITLNVVTKSTFSCARDFVIPALGVETLLPETGTVPISIPSQPAGTVLRFTCSMGMYTGQIVFQ
jgi:sulfite exporter TauE/SafE